jgi:chemotaxis protein MotB
LRRSRANAIIGAEDIWPGFTDALAGILLVLIFLITIFVVTENILTTDLSGRDETISKLNAQTKLMEEVLGLRLQDISDLRAEITATNLMLKSVKEKNAQFKTELAANSKRNVQAKKMIEDLRTSQTTLISAREKLVKKVDIQASQVEQLLQRLSAINDELTYFRHLLEDSQVQHAEAIKENKLLEAKAERLGKQLNSQIEASKKQQARANEEKKRLTAKAVSLGEKLNRLLADRVKLLSKYRSDFFGKMRNIIGEDNPDIRIIGDRFVLQSEVLFGSGSADLLPKGRDQLLRIATLLNRLGLRIPKDIPWVIQISGHTDNVPIHSQLFPSNWELSSARALHVVKYLIREGEISPKHLIATGYGEFHPLANNNTEKTRRQNRRIELKITTP